MSVSLVFRTWLFVAFAGVTSLAAAGMSPPGPTPSGATPTSATAAGGAPGGLAPAAAATPGGRVAPTEVLRLPQALARALEGSPELAPFSAEIRAAEARALQASVFPNPVLALEVEDALGGGDFRGGGMAETTLQLSQLVELGGKRRARTVAARRSTEVARSRLVEKRIDVLGDVTARFVDVLERQHELELSDEAVGLETETLRTIRRRLRDGAGSPLDEKRTEVALAGSRLEREDAEHELDVARSTLAATWGASRPDFARVEAALFVRRPVPDWETLRRRVRGSPEILRLATERRLRRAELGLARARAVPDLTLSAGPRRVEASDDHTLVFGVSVPLPLFDRNPGGVAEAKALVRKSGAEREAAAVRLEALLYRLWQELRHSGHVLEVLERDVLPVARSAQRTARSGFGRGRFSYVELVDTRRAFLDARRRRIEAAASFHRLVLAIERLTGVALEPGESDLVRGDLP